VETRAEPMAETRAEPGSASRELEFLS
jgi:hypothetical protein